MAVKCVVDGSRASPHFPSRGTGCLTNSIKGTRVSRKSHQSGPRNTRWNVACGNLLSWVAMNLRQCCIVITEGEGPQESGNWEWDPGGISATTQGSCYIIRPVGWKHPFDPISPRKVSPVPWCPQWRAFQNECPHSPLTRTSPTVS